MSLRGLINSPVCSETATKLTTNRKATKQRKIAVTLPISSSPSMNAKTDNKQTESYSQDYSRTKSGYHETKPLTCLSIPTHSGKEAFHQDIGRKENQNFYRVWISEIMLQQTQVSVVIPYYHRFMLKWPTLESFYKAKLEEILFLWQGLGYYKRAENLYKAKELLKTKKKITVSYQSLLEIPGIGDYTSSAISAILNDYIKVTSTIQY